MVVAASAVRRGWFVRAGKTNISVRWQHVAGVCVDAGWMVVGSASEESRVDFFFRQRKGMDGEGDGLRTGFVAGGSGFQ